MKTQLLEDIGENAPLSLTPSKVIGNPKAEKQVQAVAPAGSTQPGKARPDRGVWRQKPAAEPLVSPAPQPDTLHTTLELQDVFEEIAALEAQLVHPTTQPEPAIAPVEPRHELPTPPAKPREELSTPAAKPRHELPTPTPLIKPWHEPPAPPAERRQELSTPPSEPLQKPVIPPAQATPARQPAHTAAVPQDPLFDFTVPLPEQEAADPFTRPPTGLTRSRKRYLLWTACVLSVALLIQGGRWFYQERNDAGSLALIANEAREKPPGDKAVKQATAAPEAAPGPGSDPSVTPAVSASRPVSGVPPLVMLEPEPPAAARIEQTPPSVPSPAEQPAAPNPEPVAKQPSAAPLPKPPSRTARKQADAPAKRATEKPKREPVRQLARAPAVEPEKPARRDTTMTATLQACREHGYNAVQCVKRACEVTQYGFVCRGR